MGLKYKKGETMLALVGLGINGDLTLRGIELIKRAEEVYAEFYTGILEESWKKRIEELSGKRIVVLDREKLESSFLVEKAKKKRIVLLTVGDPLAATTHCTHLYDAKKKGIKVEIVHNSSIFSAAPGKCGLQHYKFGKTATLAYWKKNYEPTSALEIVEWNLKNGLHTLLLLDLDKELGAMDAKTAFLQIEKIGKKIGKRTISNLAVISRLGWKDEKINYGKISKLKKMNLGKPPFCFIIPGKLHFLEEENLQFYSVP